MLGHLPLVFVLGFAQPADGISAESSNTAYFPPNLFLVRAVTRDVKKAERQYDAGTFLITYVYAGSVSLKGRTFECSTSTGQIFTSVRLDKDRHVHFLEKGTEGLWWLYLDKEKTLRPELRGDVVDIYHIRPFPFTNGKYSTAGLAGRFDTKAEWKEGLVWAEAVETVYKAKSDDERAVILRRLAATEQSPVAGWAINLLGKVNPKGTTEFLKKLAGNEKLSAESHVVLDKTLSRLDYPKWNSKDHWERLLPRWVASDDLSYYNAGMKRLWEAGRNSEVDFALYAKILDPVLAKADRLKDGQQQWLGTVLETPPTFPSDRDRAFAWLAGQVRTGKTEFVRTHAAAGLRVFGSLKSAQLKVVRELREQSNETQVQQALDVVLRPR